MVFCRVLLITLASLNHRCCINVYTQTKKPIWAHNLKVTGSSLLVTFNCACAWMILYGLWTDVISAIEYRSFEPKIAFSVYGSSYQRTDDEQCRAWWSHLKNIIGCCNFTEAKSREVCTVLLVKGLFSKTEWRFQKICSVWPSSRLKTVNVDYRSMLLVARLVRFCEHCELSRFECRTSRTNCIP